MGVMQHKQGSVVSASQTEMKLLRLEKELSVSTDPCEIPVRAFSIGCRGMEAHSNMYTEL